MEFQDLRASEGVLVYLDRMAPKDTLEKREIVETPEVTVKKESVVIPA